MSDQYGENCIFPTISGCFFQVSHTFFQFKVFISLCTMFVSYLIKGSQVLVTPHFANFIRIRYSFLSCFGFNWSSTNSNGSSNYYLLVNKCICPHKHNIFNFNCATSQFNYLHFSLTWDYTERGRNLFLLYKKFVNTKCENHHIINMHVCERTREQFRTLQISIQMSNVIQNE